MSCMDRDEKLPLLSGSPKAVGLEENGDLMSAIWKALSPEPSGDHQLDKQDAEIRNDSNQYLHHRISGSTTSTGNVETERSTGSDPHCPPATSQDSAPNEAPLRSALKLRDPLQESPRSAGDLASSCRGSIEDNQASISDQLVMVTLLHILLLMVALVFSQSLSIYMFSHRDSSAAQLTLIVFMTVGTGVILYLYCRNDVAVAAWRSTVHGSVREKLKHILRNCLPIVGMLFFYPFSCALDLLNVIVGTGCNAVFRQCGGEFYRKHIVEVAFHVVRPIFMGAELFFCLQFHKSQFRRRTDVRTGLVLIMAVNLGLWFISLLYETEFKHMAILRANNTQLCNLSRMASDNMNDCLNQTAKKMSTLRNVNIFLYPFAIEFTLLFGEFIADKLFNCKPLGARSAKSRKCKRIQPPSTTTANSELDGTVSVESIGDLSVNVRSRSFFCGSILILSVGVIINVACCVIGYLSFSWRNVGGLEVKEVYYCFSIFYWSLTTFLSLLGFVCSRSFVYRDEIMRGIDYMVLLTGLGPMLLEIVDLTFLLKVSNRSVKHWIRIGCRVTSIIQLTVQVPFMFYSDRVKLTESDRNDPRLRKLEAVFKAIVLYQALCNGATWIVDSILNTNIEVMEQIPMQSNIFIEIVGPFAIFFRFNSFLLFLRAYLGE